MAKTCSVVAGGSLLRILRAGGVGGAGAGAGFGGRCCPARKTIGIFMTSCQERRQWRSTLRSSSSFLEARTSAGAAPSCWQRPSIRSISTKAARQLLGFSYEDRPTIRELRAAYFEAAKKTHPDLLNTHNENSTTTVDNEDDDEDDEDDDSGDAFRRVTEAYERLLASPRELSKNNDNGGESSSFVISQKEEDEYRQACWLVLGIRAEIVEESKSNPMFRHWLGGNTDGAQHWRAFFAVHGGLAQKLRQPSALISSGRQDEEEQLSSTTRRRRRRKR
jgi:hypothetical protein